VIPLSAAGAENTTTTLPTTNGCVNFQDVGNLTCVEAEGCPKGRCTAQGDLTAKGRCALLTGRYCFGGMDAWRMSKVKGCFDEMGGPETDVCFFLIFFLNVYVCFKLKRFFFFFFCFFVFLF
jgi:hypothetical protein